MRMQFDQVSKAVAAGLTRRRLMELAGVGVGGGVLAAATPTAFAAGPSSCAVFCGKTSFSSGPAHAACLRACKQCHGNVSGICTGPAGSVCCAPGTSCCVTAAGAATCCPAGQACIGGTCAVPPSYCIPTCADTCAGSTTSCLQTCAGGTPGCACVSTVEGNACVQEICTFVTCTSSADCGPGSVCFTQGCC